MSFRSAVICISFLIFTGCLRKDQNVILEVDNVEINFSGKGSFRYATDMEREKAKNIINFRIVNNSEDKLLFLFDYLNCRSLNKMTTDLNDFAFVLLDKNNNYIIPSAPLVTFTDTPELSQNLKYEIINDSLNNEHYKDLGGSYDWRNLEHYMKNSFVLHPGESRALRTVIKLPIVKENIQNFGNIPIYYNEVKDNYKFILFYGADSELIKKSLPDYILMDLESNGIKIFDGIIKSKPIPLKEK